MSLNKCQPIKHNNILLITAEYFKCFWLLLFFCHLSFGFDLKNKKQTYFQLYLMASGKIDVQAKLEGMWNGKCMTEGISRLQSAKDLCDDDGWRWLFTVFLSTGEASVQVGAMTVDVPVLMRLRRSCRIYELCSRIREIPSFRLWRSGRRIFTISGTAWNQLPTAYIVVVALRRTLISSWFVHSFAYSDT